MDDLLFGEQTDWYQNLYSHGIIDNRIWHIIWYYKTLSVCEFFAETDDYDILTQEIQSQIDDYQNVLESQQNAFESLRRATVGEGIQKLNSLENMALQGDDVLFGTNLLIR